MPQNKNAIVSIFIDMSASVLWIVHYIFLNSSIFHVFHVKFFFTIVWLFARERDVAHNFNINLVHQSIPCSQFGWIYAGCSKSGETVVIAPLLVGHYLPFDCGVFIDFRNDESLLTRDDGMRLGSYWPCRSGNVL